MSSKHHPVRVIESPGRFFEDFRLHEVIPHATPRTLTEGDASLYVALTGSRHALWSCANLAAGVGLPNKPLHDLLVFNMAFGKTVPDISLNAIANLGYADVRFLTPVYSGDSLHCESVVIGLKLNSSGKSGVVYVRSTAYRQDGVAVLTWVRWVMVRSRSPMAMNSPMKSDHVLVPNLPSFVPQEELTVSSLLRPGLMLDEWCESTGSQLKWDHYTVGDRMIHPSGVTIEEADHMMATRLYQNNAKVHFDAHAMAGTPGGKRIVYGGHVISTCHALSYDGLENVMSIASINAGSHLAPTFAGDTLYAMTEVLDRWKIQGRADIGALRLRLRGYKNVHPAKLFTSDVSANSSQNAEDEAHHNLVLELDYTALIPRKLSSKNSHAN